MSVLAQDFALSSLYPAQQNDIDNALRLARAYLSAPQNFRVSAFTGKDRGTESAAYSCAGCHGASYLFERYMYDHYGGDSYLVTSHSNLKVGQAGIEQYSGKPLASVMTDFGIALAASNTSINTNAAYTFTGIDLRSTYTDQQGNQVSLNGPTPMNSLTPSSSSNLQAYLGSVFFLNGTNIGTTNVQVNDLAGTVGLSVRVVQQ